ncbi:MAG: bifunctional demethylmenaquinone methyltransferase/2-methoxy-6-polyprenyl-1,4-benzoquinol methylase UbiE [Prevotella sp.]|nr:bifunctional demethylmenaquinone methyltransferase/2-methoxy-6-polyprenyl-1,4-benzoquinol methylase UbiE [Prevotella sp.]
MPYSQEKIMPYGNLQEKSRQVEKMFNGIAHSYDMLNHRLSFGIDHSWRRKAIAWLIPFKPQTVLDVATGTGDFALLVSDILKPKKVVGIDISDEMMRIGREKVRNVGKDNVISFERGDCGKLEFPDNTFDAVTAAFGIRNFQDLDTALKEMCRVLKQNGHASILELSCPTAFPMRQLFWLYSHTALQIYGTILSKDKKAYSYLTDTIEAFPKGEVVVEALKRAGFSEVGFKPLTFGTCIFYYATK